MEGALFYWFAWISWVWVTFLLSKKNFVRYGLSAYLLILMISTPYRISILGIEVFLSAFVLITVFVVGTAKLNKRSFYSVFLSAFIMMLGYVCFLLFELFDPVWVLFDRKWMLALSALILCSFLQDRYLHRFYCLLSGMLCGEILFAIIMEKLSFNYSVSSPAFMDMLAITFMILALWSGFNYLMLITSNIINYGRGKQKSS